MQNLIVRHRRENLKKCSLRGLENRSDLQFLTYPKDEMPQFGGYLMLTMDEAPVLSSADSKSPILLLDATWRWADTMVKNLNLSRVIPRRLPEGIVTAYPRRQEDCVDPEKGLASVEALFVAYKVLGWDTKGLLDHYYWKSAFLEKNQF